MPHLSETTLRSGEQLVFVLGAFRSGTTLLRKILDTHPAIYASAETWFMLPLTNLWSGLGEHPTYNPKQAAAALQQHIAAPDFTQACAAFAASVYASAARRAGQKNAAIFVDKTPLYTQIAEYLPLLFPRARFIILARDPRAIAWSRHTWRHASSGCVTEHFDQVAQDFSTLATFFSNHSHTSIVARYEDLCAHPSEQASAICKFLDVPSDPAMVQYGSHHHHEGYGDENTRRHAAPHTESLNRWDGSEGMSEEHQHELLSRCPDGALAAIGYHPTVGV